MSPALAPARAARRTANAGPSWARTMASRFAAPGGAEGKWATPADLAQELDPTFKRTPAIELVNREITWALTTPDARLMVSMAPQEGKSHLCTKFAPTWQLQRRPDTRIVIASYQLGIARRMGRGIRDEIKANPGRLGVRLREDVSSQNEFEIAGRRGGVYAVGVEGALTSRSADALIIDDPLKGKKEANSKTYREMVWDFWQGTASSRLSGGAPVVVIMTRWHEDDLIGRLLHGEDAERWRVVNIPAQADHDPEKGETDPLGREPGEFMISARGRTQLQWEQRKITAGSSTWAALYQGRPTPPEGDVFLRQWWNGPGEERRYAQPLWVVRDDGSRWVPGVAGHGGTGEIVQSWDMAFKATDRSDYVVGQVWLRRGPELYLLDQVRGRLTFPQTVQAVRDLSARWPQALLKMIEDKANGPAVIAALKHHLPGIVPIDPDGSKTARAEAVSPLVEAGNVHLPTAELAPWVSEFIDEHAAFPNASHDDQVDAFSQAANRLVLLPLQRGESLVDQEEFYEEDDEDVHGYLM